LSDVRIDTEIDIDSPIERVWEVLCDFGSYSEWNPMIRSADGVARKGERVTLRFHPDGQKEHVFRPRLTVVDPCGELRWLGNPRFPGLIDSQHYFILTDAGGGTTHLLHGTVYYGLLVPLMRSWIEASTRIPFEDMNKALRSRVESPATGARF
jgi:hypothetical protein